MSGSRNILSVPLGLWLALVLLGSPAQAVSHVIHISIDGLRGDLLQANLIAAPADYPNFKRLVDEGSATFNARTDYTNTQTLPNHTSMISGRPVEQPAGAANTTHHGYDTDGIGSSSTTLHNAGNPNLAYVASTFDVVHDHGLSTALYASKDKFALFEQSYDASSGAPDVTGPDNGRAKIDSSVVVSHFVQMQTMFLSGLAAQQFNYSFLHHSLLDGVGHNAGWESDSWNNSLQLIDSYLGELLEVVEATESLSADTAIVLTADHGGSGTGHGSITDPDHYTVPVLVWGEGVAPGADLYALNPFSRIDPGNSRPSYTANEQPIRNGDTGNLALQLLGLGPVSGSTINGSQDLAFASAFAADFDGNQAVDAADLRNWQTGYGSKVGVLKSYGDANGSGTVDARDFLVWQRQVGSSLASPVLVVPEPGAFTLLLSLVVATICVRRQKNQLYFAS